MNSRVVTFIAKILSCLNVCYQESLFGKAFNKLWNALGRAFSGSFIYRFFSDESRFENFWENSIFGKIVNLPKKFIMFLQRKLSPFFKNKIKTSAICNAFSSWNLVSVRIYGVAILAFSVATTFLRENSRFTLALLIATELFGLLLVLY